MDAKWTRDAARDDVGDTSPDPRRRHPCFIGRCYLCGAPINPGRLFCYAHSWAGR